MRDRIMAVVTLLLLNLATIGAALGVVKLTPNRDLVARPPAVAHRVLILPAGAAIPAAGTAAPLPGNSLYSRLNALLKPNMNAVVIDAESRRVVYDQRGDQGAVPASTTKLVTSVAVLASLGPDYRLTTRVVRGQGANGIVLVGGGDPTLAGPPTGRARPATYPRPASLVDLAKQTADSLKKAGVTDVRVDYDASMYSGPRMARGWKPDYLSTGQVAPITSLMIDEGLLAPGGPAEGADRVSDPSGVAAKTFATLLKRSGVNARVGAQVTAARGASELGQVQSPPVSTLVEQLMTSSDNDLAEALARQVAIKRGLTGDFAGGAQGVHDTLAELGLAAGVQTFDGSGLSHDNHITPVALARVVSAAASGKYPNLRAAITGMPVAGFSGTLANRYAGSGTQSGAGVVRAKTGTLDGVNTLAGLAFDADGRLLAFAFMANNVTDPAAAMGSLDQLASTVASCGCT